MAVRERLRPWRNRLRRTLRAEVTGARRLLAQPAVGPRQLVAAAERMRQLRQPRLALALATRADREFGHRPEIARLRRSVPGFVGAANDSSIREALRDAGRSAPGWVTSTAVGVGRGSNTEVVVRHQVRPGSLSVIRKSVRGAQPAEALLYRSGLVARSNGGWRAPTAWKVGQQSFDRWHIFLEDLRPRHRAADAHDLRAITSALAALAADLSQHWTAGQDWLPRPPLPALTDLATGVRRWAAGLPDPQGRRLLSTYEKLLTCATPLTAAYGGLPPTLCHGDMNLSNVMLDRPGGGPPVIFDWSAVHIGPVGTDLGQLLALPNPGLRQGPVEPAECWSAYRASLNPDIRHEAELGYRFRLVWKSLRWQATRSDLAPAVLPQVEAERVCAAAQWILAEVGS